MYFLFWALVLERRAIPVTQVDHGIHPMPREMSCLMRHGSGQVFVLARFLCALACGMTTMWKCSNGYRWKQSLTEVNTYRCKHICPTAPNDISAVLSTKSRRISSYTLECKRRNVGMTKHASRPPTFLYSLLLRSGFPGVLMR